jgi:integrase
MTKRRAPGTGSITHRGGDRYLVRLVLADGTRRARTIRARDAADAREQVDALLGTLEAAGQMSPGGTTFRGWAQEWLHRRDLAGSLSAEHYELRLRLHLLTAPWADDLLQNLTPTMLRAHITSLLDKRIASKRKGSTHLTPRTVAGVLSTLRTILEEAVDAGLLDANPAREVHLPKGRRPTVSTARTTLTPDELRRLLACDEIADGDRLLIAFAFTTGLRAGELFSLRLDDIEETERGLVAHVRRAGHRKTTTKGKRARVVPVFGPARTALDWWLARVPRDRESNPHQLVFPGARGGRRWTNDGAKWLRDRLALAGITRHVRFHDLRHTAGTALVSGWLGAAWRREDVQEILGHASAAQTEHYARIASNALFDAADRNDAAPILRARITPPATALGLPAKQGESARAAEGSSSSSRSAVFSGAWVGGVPSQILRGITERLVALAATGQATEADALAWRDAIRDLEPEALRAARAVGGEDVIASALEAAEVLLRWLDSQTQDGGTAARRQR